MNEHRIRQVILSVSPKFRHDQVTRLKEVLKEREPGLTLSRWFRRQVRLALGEEEREGQQDD